MNPARDGSPPVNARTRAAGRLLLAIAAIHAAFGVWMGRRQIAAVAGDGFLDAIDPHLDRNMVFWFLLVSPLMWILGRFTSWVAAESRRPPAWLGRDLLIVTLVGAVLMPVSGIWLLLAPAVLLIASGRGERAASEPR